MIASADGCRGRWLTLTLDDEGRMGFEVLDTGAVFGLLPRLRALAIDVPIGLTSGPPRDCDRAARQLLGRPRSSSVFPAPIRSVLRATSHADASRRSERACGKRMSKQAFNLLPAVRAVDRALRRAGAGAERVYEAHPEVSFHVCRGAAMRHSKKSPAGKAERRRLTERAYPGWFGTIRRGVPRRLAADDDVLDALVLLWTAERIAAGTALHLPPRPPVDRYGLRMSIAA